MSRFLDHVGWSLPIARIAGTTIYVHWTFALLIASTLLQQETWTFDSIVSSLISLFVLFTCVVLHELGHSITARVYGIPAKTIVLWPFGGAAFLTREPEKPRHDLFISAAGPVVNLMIAIAAIPVYIIVAIIFGSTSEVWDVSPEHLSFEFLIGWIFAVNMILTLFNLIPALPLDGGHILRSVLLMRMSRAQTGRIMKIVGYVCAGICAIIGIAIWDLLLVYIALLMAASANSPLPSENEENKSRADESPQPPDTAAVPAAATPTEYTAFPQPSRPTLNLSTVPAAASPVLHMTTPRENRYKTGPLPESHLEAHKQPVVQNAPTASGTIAVEVFAVLNLILAGLTFIIWVLICLLLLSDFFSSEIDGETVIGVFMIILLPGLISFFLFLLSGIGLLRRRVWGYYVHLSGAILMALTIVGLIYAIPALIFMFKPAFRARFFPHQVHQT